MWSSEAWRGRAVALLIVPLLAFVAQGCGFQLQGRNRLPEYMSVVHVATEDNHTSFARELRRALDASGIRVVEDASAASTTVRILKDEAGQRVLSVSARNTPEEYEVYYDLVYAVESRGNEVLAPQELRLERNYAYDETAVLAKQREEQQLRDAMARDLASRVIRRLATL